MILIQPEERQLRKTDRRDTAALSELLWGNRDRFLAGKPVRGLRQVELPSLRNQENRRLTTLRKEASQGLTRIVNKIKHLLRHHNQLWDMPPRPSPIAICGVVPLGCMSQIDRLEMDDLLVLSDQKCHSPMRFE